MSIIDKLNKQSDYVKQSYKIFKDFYGNSFKETLVSDIVNGESITIHESNILVNDLKGIIDEDYFEKICKTFCTKKLYDYQKNAIKKLRELELEFDNSNGYLLSLPIGSGKSLVFQFLALFYRNIPKHPIIISTDGTHIPENDQLQWKLYPFYYENCCIQNSNCAICLENYEQRPITIILTHIHLIDQMKFYFETDFPKAIQHIKIFYTMDYKNLKQNINNYDIIVINASPENVNYLMELSYEKPFMRLIIDDYTSMPYIESFRQIRSSSTIFVSGSGFNRKDSEIPVSYYTLKNIDYKKITVVGKPEETFEGVYRDSIATLELIGSNNEFSQYEFVNLCEEISKQKYHMLPIDLYNLIKEKPLLSSYLSFAFIIKNIDKIRSSINQVEKDLNSENKLLEPNRVKYYLKWKNSLNKNMYDIIYSDQGISNINNISPIIDKTVCINCQTDNTKHNGFGMISTCCGAFYCYKCLKMCCTKKIVNYETNEEIIDEENYYCCCCHSKNPNYLFNITKQKDKSIYAYNLVKDYFYNDDLNDIAYFDYYFYMFENGFTPNYFEGNPISTKQNLNEIPVLEKILPKDQLALLSIQNINECLKQLKITPQQNTFLLFYGCPKYMIHRVNNFIENIISKDKNSPIAKLKTVFLEDTGQLIGIHLNIIGIIEWKRTNKKDERLQIFGRILRMNNYNNPLHFFISTTTLE